MNHGLYENSFKCYYYGLFYTFFSGCRNIWNEDQQVQNPENIADIQRLVYATPKAAISSLTGRMGEKVGLGGYLKDFDTIYTMKNYKEMLNTVKLGGFRTPLDRLAAHVFYTHVDVEDSEEDFIEVSDSQSTVDTGLRGGSQSILNTGVRGDSQSTVDMRGENTDARVVILDNE
jgi:hypothetical protein